MMTATTELPKVLAEIAAATSEEVALKLAEDFGGVSVWVPHTVKPEHRLARSVGVEAARTIAELFGEGELSVPQGPTSFHWKRTAEIRELLRQGKTAREVAQRVGCDVRTVRRHRHQDAARSA